MSEEPVRDADGDDEILGFDRRKALLAIGLAIVLAVAAFAVIGEVADYGRLLHAAKRANKLWLPLAVGGEVLAYAGYVLAYHCVARADGGPRLPYWTVTRVVGLGFGAFVVGSSAGGLAVDFWALKRAGLKAHESARRVLALNTLEWAVLAWLAVAAAVVLLAIEGGGAPIPMALGWICVVPTCTAIAVYVTQPARYERLASLKTARDRPTGFDLRGWVLWLLDEARRGLADAIGGVGLVREILASPVEYAAGVLGFPVYWLGDLLTLYASLRAFGAHIHPPALVLAYTTAYVLTVLPLPAGGAGSIETVLALTLHAVGVPLAPALLAAFLYRGFAFWLPIVPALALLPSMSRLNDDLPKAAQ